MKLQHKTPCKECPWRTDSPQGWLGGYKPEFYADAVQMNEIPACHLKDFGPDCDKTAMCAGALAVTKNSALAPYRTEGAMEARELVGGLEDCFTSVAKFYKYHSGEEYVHPMIRLMKERDDAR